jgi:hypothetical protein
MTNADSASNMLWLINQATAGELSLSGGGAPPAAAQAAAEEEKKKSLLSGGGASFNDFKIDANA